MKIFPFKKQKKILFVSRLSINLFSGSARHFYDLIHSYSKKGFQVYFLSLFPKGSPKFSLLKFSKVARLIRYENGHIHLKKNPLIPFRRTLRTKSMFPIMDQEFPVRVFDAPLSALEIEIFKKVYAHIQPEIVFADYSWITPIFDHIPKSDKIEKICFLHDFRVRVAPIYQKNKLIEENTWSIEKESALLNKADAVVLLGDEDKVLAQKMLDPSVKIIQVGMRAKRRSKKTYLTQTKTQCLYVASNAQENLLSIQWFLLKVWPLILKAVPHAECVIAGTVCYFIKDSHLKEVKNVVLKGKVSDSHLSRLYSSSLFSVIPHQIPGGIKIKLVEAMSYLCPTIGNTCVYDGMNPDIYKCGFSTDNPTTFASSAIEMFKSKKKRKEVKKEIQKYIHNHLSDKTAYQELDNFLITK